MNIRGSRAGLAFACPGSLRAEPGEVLVETANEGAPLGTAVHACLRSVVLGQESEDVRAVAMRHGVDVDELGRLVQYGVHAWRGLAAYYPDPTTEADYSAEAPGFTLTGHMDVLSVGDIWANILDWKSGYREPSAYHQMMAYAALLSWNHPGVEKIRATVVWLRDWSQETIEITPSDVYTWKEELISRVVLWEGQYTAGTHCQFCPRFVSCPGRQALVRSAVSEIEPLGEAPPIEAVARMYREGKLAVMKRILDQVDQLIRQHCATIGPIDLGNGRELALKPEPRDTIDPLKAWPIISDQLTNEELAPCIKIGKTALLDAIAAIAPKGQKARAKASLMSLLEEAGAVEHTTIQKLVERKREETPDASH